MSSCVYTPCISLILMEAEKDFKYLGIGVLVHCEPNEKSSTRSTSALNHLAVSLPPPNIFIIRKQRFFLAIMIILLSLRSLLGLCDDCKQVIDNGTNISFSAFSLPSA